MERGTDFESDFNRSFHISVSDSSARRLELNTESDSGEDLKNFLVLPTGIFTLSNDIRKKKIAWRAGISIKKRKIQVHDLDITTGIGFAVTG